MTPSQYRAALSKLDLTQVGAARLFGVNEATSRRWAASGVHGTVVIMLRLLMAGKITVEDIQSAKSV